MTENRGEPEIDAGVKRSLSTLRREIDQAGEEIVILSDDFLSRSDRAAEIVDSLVAAQGRGVRLRVVIGPAIPADSPLMDRLPAAVVKAPAPLHLQFVMIDGDRVAYLSAGKDADAEELRFSTHTLRNASFLRRLTELIAQQS
jgi:sugar-specific transcriptional regulator TrmB